MLNKKAIVLLFLILLLVGTVSAELITFDNVKSYDEETQTVTVKNLFGLGTTYADITLNTPIYNKVGVGYVPVWEKTFKVYEDYENALIEEEYFNIKEDMKPIQIDLDYKYKVVNLESGINTICSTDNKTLIETCENIPYEREIITWEDYNSKDLQAGEITIRGYTTTKEGDNIEHIPTYFGERINEWSSWDAGLNVGLEGYWKLDNNDFSDAHNSNDITNVGTVNMTGKILDGRDSELGDGDYMNTSLVFPSDAWTVQGWIKPESLTSYQAFFGTGDLDIWAGISSTGLVKVHTGVSGLIYSDTDTTPIVTGTWQHLGITWDGSSVLKIYYNGVSQSTTVTGVLQDAQDGLVLQFGKRNSAVTPNYFDGGTDELSAYSRELTPTEMNYTWFIQKDGFVNGSYTNVFGTNPIVTAISPANNTVYTNSPQVTNFTCYGSDGENFTDMEFYLNGALNETNSTGLNNTNYVFSPTLIDGVYNWSCTGYDDEANTDSSETWYITIDTTPFIEFLTPPTLVNYANITQEYIPMKVNVSPTTYFKNISFDLYNVNGTSYNLLFTNTTFDINFTDMPDAHYHYNVTTYTTTNQRNITETRHINHDTTAPEIVFQSPLDLYEYLTIGQDIDLNFTVTDIGGSLDSCWHDYNGTNYTDACTDGVQFNTTLIQEALNFNVTAYANDTLGNLNSELQTWNYIILENYRVFDATAIQTAQETFIFVGVKSTDITSTTGRLWYNGSSYTSLVANSGSNLNLTNVISIPVTSEGNVSFFWEITYTNSTGTYQVNTTSSEQTVGDLVMAECFSPAIDGLTLNFTTYDSTNLTILNSTLEATFQFYAEGGAGDVLVEYLFSDLNENRSNYMYCLNSSGQNVTLDSFISYGATDYDNREYIINDGIIGNFTQSIPLYLTQTVLSDIVTITVQDQSYDPLSGALVAIQRWNIGTNTYSTIGMFTTSSVGQGIMDLELYNTWYRGVVEYEGIIVEVTDVQKLPDTTWTITAQLGVDNPYDLFGDISHGLTFSNTTNITSFTWLDTSGYTQNGCLVVKNSTTSGLTTIFDSCVESVSGTINYLLVGTGNFVAYGVIELDGYNQSQIVDTLHIRLGTPEIISTVSPYGKVISFLLIGTAGAIGVASGSVILGGVLLIAVLFGIMKMGFLNITTGFIWGIVMIIIIILAIARRRK